MGEWRYSSIHSEFSRWLEESNQLHAPSALLPGKTFPVPFEQKTDDRRNRSGRFGEGTNPLFLPALNDSSVAQSIA